MILDEKSPSTNVSTTTLDNGWVEKTTEFTFDYSYREIPSEIFLYLDPQYTVKVPFVSLEWTYPDYKSEQMRKLFMKLRGEYSKQLKEDEEP